MRKIFAALILSTLISVPALASDADDALAAVHHFTSALNKGDIKTASAACAQIVEMTDDIPPYEWHGEGACAKWLGDAGAYGQASGFKPGPMILGKPRHALLTDQHAYLVIPATFTYSLKGKQEKQMGSLLTVALTKGATGWYMVAWTWSDGKTTEAESAPGR